MSYQLTGVKHYEVEEIWPHVSHMLTLALLKTRGELTLDDVLEGLETKRFQLWLAITDSGKIKGAGITQIKTYPEFNVGHLLLVAGLDFHEWLHFGAALEAWAASYGAEYFEFWGRKGLEKYAKNLGYDMNYIVMSKKLTPINLQ